MRQLELLVRFASQPNSLGYCGPKKAEELFKTYLETGRGEATLRKKFASFEGMMPYLRLIARANNLKPFDPKVAEAYWIGNNLLENVTYSDLRKTILSGFPLPRKMAQHLAKNLPKQALPHHSFHVFYIHSVTGRVNLSLLKLQDTCRVGWGKVTGLEPLTVLSKRVAVAKTLTFSPPKPLKVLNSANLALKKGDILAFHWGEAALKLTAKQVANLEKYTKIGLSCVRPTSSS